MAYATLTEKMNALAKDTLFEVLIASDHSGECTFCFVTAKTWMDALVQVENLWNCKYPNAPFQPERFRFEFVLHHPQ